MEKSKEYIRGWNDAIRHAAIIIPGYEHRPCGGGYQPRKSDKPMGPPPIVGSGAHKP